MVRETPTRWNYAALAPNRQNESESLMSGEDPRLLAAERAIAGLKARITEMEAAFRDAGSGWSGPPKPLKARVRAIRSQRTLGPHPGKVASLAWATAPHLCASACQEGRLIVWDTLRGVDVVNVDLRRQWVRSVALDFQ